jgi:hypothetical protein
MSEPVRRLMSGLFAEKGKVPLGGQEVCQCPGRSSAPACRRASSSRATPTGLPRETRAAGSRASSEAACPSAPDHRKTSSSRATPTRSSSGVWAAARAAKTVACSSAPASRDDLWQTDLWPDEAPTGPAPNGGLHGSAPWFLGYHALLTLDYDLAAEFQPWAPPPPFDDNTCAFPNRRFTKPELLRYVGWCRGRVRQTLDGLTEEKAARPLPSAHRYHGMLFVVVAGSMPLHVVEHASQIRQFLTAAGVTVQPLPGDRGYTG